MADETASGHEDQRPWASLGSAFLEQAMESLSASGSSDALLPMSLLPAGVDADSLEGRLTLNGRTARRRRVAYARASVLFSILSVEAYANQFLRMHLSRSDFDAADKLAPADKILLGPRIAVGRSLFSRGDDTFQDVSALLARRRHLVHAKPTRDGHSRLDRGTHWTDPLDAKHYNPKVAAKYVVAVATTVAELQRNSTPPWNEVIVDAIVSESATVLAFGERAHEALAQGPPERDLLFAVLSLAARCRAPGRGVND